MNDHLSLLAIEREMERRKGSSWLLIKVLVCIAFVASSSKGITETAAADRPQVTAMFAFGDSLTDPGNNNYLSSLAKANYAPYGIDFDRGIPSGRFCNGRTIIDYLGDLLGLPLLPAYASPAATGRNIMQGVNYASASAGILDETGGNLGERFSFSQQVDNFASNLNQLRSEMGDQQLSQYLRKSLAVIILGSNDYINNYLITLLYPTSYIYTPTSYADLLIKQYTRQILVLYNLGLRKFLLAGVGPLGCIPNQLATHLAPPGKCASFANEIAVIFNIQLRSLVNQLNMNCSDAIFVYGNTYGAFSDILSNANRYGFTVTDRGCCGIGRNQGQITCLPLSVPCINRNQYLFWDAFHPTQAVNRILAEKAYNGSSSDCYPMNVKRMAQR